MQQLTISAVMIAVWITVAVQPPANATSHETPGNLTPGAAAELTDRENRTIGKARLVGTPNGVLITVDLDRAAAGEHAFHIHEVGRCDAPTFESAGGHFNPTGAEHGFLIAKGPHAGDLPNIHVHSSGQLSFEYLADGIALEPGGSALIDADGSALVLHAAPDDYRTDPAGGAGDRLACGVIRKE